MSSKPEVQKILLTPREVGGLFRVTAKTVTRWALTKRIGSTRTLGGHRRFYPEEVRKLIELNYSGSAGDLAATMDALDKLLEHKKIQES